MAVVTELTLLVVVDLHAVVFNVEWDLAGLALVTEAAAAVGCWRRSRSGE